MKRHCKLIISVITMALVITIFPLQPKAYADPFTASQIASTAYAMMQSWGIAFSAGSATAGGMNEFMAEQVEDYATAQGGSVSDIFVGHIAVDLAGKLVVGQQMYNSVVSFLGWLSNKFGLSTTSSDLSKGEFEDLYLPTGVHQGIIGTQPTGVGLEVLFYSESTPSTGYSGYNVCAVYVDGTYKGGPGPGYLNNFLPIYYVDFNGQQVVLFARAQNKNDGSQFWQPFNVVSIQSLENSLSWSVPQNWTAPTVLNPDKEWTGTIGGYSYPDINLDDLLDDIDEAVADNNLVVDGEVIDIPVPPTPSPAPIDPDTPLSDVPWEGLDNNLKDLYEQGLEEIGTIGEGFDNVIDTLSGFYDSVIEWLENIYSKLGDLLESLVDALENILEAIQDIAESILNADANWFSDIVDAILTPFQRWITALKSATGIWHYVIEWLQCIATPFGFFWGILSGIGACFVRPIYAVAAFAIVIAIYKRFGK